MRKLYAGDSVLGVDLGNTVSALDSSTIDLCLSLFDLAPFRSTKAALKLHTLLELRGATPAFIHVSDGNVNVLDMLVFEAGAFYVMDRGYVDFKRLYALHQAGAFFVTCAKSPMMVFAGMALGYADTSYRSTRGAATELPRRSS